MSIPDYGPRTDAEESAENERYEARMREEAREAAAPIKGNVLVWRAVTGLCIERPGQPGTYKASILGTSACYTIHNYLTGRKPFKLFVAGRPLSPRSESTLERAMSACQRDYDARLSAAARGESQ
jgi:hypothetical protein